MTKEDIVIECYSLLGKLEEQQCEYEKYQDLLERWNKVNIDCSVDVIERIEERIEEIVNNTIDLLEGAFSEYINDIEEKSQNNKDVYYKKLSELIDLLSTSIENSFIIFDKIINLDKEVTQNTKNKYRDEKAKEAREKKKTEKESKLKEINRMREEGYTQKEIGERFGVRERTIRRWLKC